MSRSDRPQAAPGHRPAQPSPAAPQQSSWGYTQPPVDPYDPNAGYAQYPQAAPQAQYQNPDPYGYGHQGYYPGNEPLAGQGQPAPQAPAYDPAYGQAPQSQHQHPAAAYGQPYEQPAYAAQPQQPQTPGYGRGYEHAPPYQPAAAHAAPARPDLRGAVYDQPGVQTTSAEDPRAYDLSAYMPARPSAAPEPAAQPRYTDWGHQNDTSGYTAPAYGNAQGNHYYADGAGLTPAHGQPAYAGQGYAADPYAQGGYADPNFADPGAQQATGYDSQDDTGEYEDDHAAEPPRRSRTMMMVGGALVVAIVVGGGLALAYQALLGPAASDKPQVVKNTEGPLRTKPDNAGGKQVPHTDSKLLGRLGGDDASGGTDASGARKVSTLVVGRDGKIEAPAPAIQPPQAAVSVPVPGMTIIDVGNAPSTTEAVAAATASDEQRGSDREVRVAEASVSRSENAPPAKPIVIANVAPKLTSNSDVTTQSVDRSEAVQLDAVTPPKSRETKSESGSREATPASDAYQPSKSKVAAVDRSEQRTSSPAATGPVPTGAGYVAVLASVPASSSSHLEALKQFADLQQQYPSVLQSKTPDVQEANLGEKGRYHRLLVGPPGSKDSANSVCAGLKTAGYVGCWVLAY